MFNEPKVKYNSFSLQDQVDQLRSLKINAVTINSKISESERKRVINDLYAVSTTTSLLYVTPEQAATGFFKVG